jgi:hypothetical protein
VAARRADLTALLFVDSDRAESHAGELLKKINP